MGVGMKLADMIPLGVRYDEIGGVNVFWKGFTFTPTNAATATPVGDRLSGERDYGVDIGDGSGSTLIGSCVSWIANAFVQTYPVVMRYRGADRFGEADRRHPAARLIRRPTLDPDTGRSSYSWIPLIQATVLSLVVDGNSYWLKRRSLSGAVVQLWYVPHWMIEPIAESGSTRYIDFYRYRPGGRTIELPPSEVVHFRDGLDPDNVRKGMSKTKKLLREIYTDEAAARFTASLLRRHSVPGIIVAPKMPLENPDDAKDVQRRLDEDFTGDNRGRSMALLGPADVFPYGFSPEQMKLGDLRDIPEERVSAATGVQAAVVGFGSGLQSTKVGATMAELVDLSWQNGALPPIRLVQAEATEQLLPDFDDVTEDDEILFDTSHVPIMADYHTKIAQKHEVLVKGGIEMRSEARRANGLKTGADDDVYVLASGAQVVKPDGSPLFEPPKPDPAPSLPVPIAQPALMAGKSMEMKPIGPFADFAACVAHMRSADGGSHSEESARKICGAMEAEANELTPRQVEVAKLLAEGVLHKNIAVRLRVSDRTAERDIAAVREWQKVAVAAGS